MGRKRRLRTVQKASVPQSTVYRETRQRIMKAFEYGKKRGATREQTIQYVRSLALHSIGGVIISTSAEEYEKRSEINRAINDVLHELETGKIKW